MSVHPPSTGVVTIFHVSHSEKCVVTSHWDSNLHSLMADDVGHNSMCSIAHLHILFGEMSSCLQSIFKLGWLFVLGVVCFGTVWVCRLFT